MATINWRGKDGATAYLQWHEHGQRVKRSLGKILPHEAETIRLAKELELRTSTTINGQTVKGISQQYLNWHQREYETSHDRIKQIITQHLLPHFGDYHLDAIPTISIEDYKHRRSNSAKTETINKELRTLVAVVNKSIEWGASFRPLKIKYMKNLDSKPVKFFTHAELQIIYKASNDWPIWKFLANTGIRRSELLNLTPDDIKCGALYVQSTNENRTKSGKWRIIPLSPGAEEALKQLNLPVKIQGATLSVRFSRLLKSIGIEGSLHTLRHTFCSHLVMSGIDLSTVQQLAGHSTIRITERYAHLSPEHLANSTQNLDL